MPTTFLNLENAATSTLRADHAIGDGSLKVQAGHGTKFGSTWPARITVIHVTSGAVSIFRLSGRSTDDLTVSAAIEGTSDVLFPAGSTVEMRWTKGAKTDIEGAVNTLEAGGGGGGGGGNPAGTDGQLQVKAGAVFGAIAGSATGTNAIAVGAGCVATGNNSIAAGTTSIVGTGGGIAMFAFGADCTADAEVGCVAMGSHCEAVDGAGDGGCDWAFAMGSYNRSQSCASVAFGSNGLADVQNKLVIGNGVLGSASTTVGAGDSQLGIQPLGGISTDATPVVLATGGPAGPGNTIIRPIVRSGATYGFTATIVGRMTDGSASAMFIRSGLIHNEAGTTALVGSVATIGTDNNTPGWAVAITADDTNDAIQVAVTGEATVHWTCRLDCTEVK